MGILRGSTIKLPKVRFLIFVSIIALPIHVNIERIGDPIIRVNIKGLMSFISIFKTKLTNAIIINKGN